MPEPMVEQIEAALEASLAGIVGDSGANYWYTPSAAVRFADLTDQCLDTERGKRGPIYILSHDRIETNLGVARVVDRVLFLDVAALYLMRRTTPEGPFVVDPSERYKIQNRMAGDISKKLTGGDLTLGGLVTLTEVINASMAAEETWLDSWALVFLRLRVSYRAARSAA
jgi:hypothetical protein